MRVYLAGLIAGKAIKDCILWRSSIISQYRAKNLDIEFINPLKSKNIKSISDNGYHSDIPSKAIVEGDLMAIEGCDLLVANMNKFGETRDLIGTLSEIAIAHTLGIPVIMISDDPMYTEHPFLKHFVTINVATVQDLVNKEYLEYFLNRVTQCHF